MKPRIGWYEYKSPRIDCNQQFEITDELIREFGKMEEEQFDCYDEFNRNHVWGMFGSKDTIAHFRDEFEKYYSISINFDGPHTMTAENVRKDLIPVISKMQDEVKPIRKRYFRHFLGGKYRLRHVAKDSETLGRMVVYQALYGEYGSIHFLNFIFKRKNSLNLEAVHSIKGCEIDTIFLCVVKGVLDNKPVSTMRANNINTFSLVS